MTEPFQINVDIEQGQEVPVVITPKNPYGKSAEPISLSLNYSDKNLEAIKASFDKFKDVKDDMPIEQQKKAVSTFYEVMFGKGTFDKLYKITQSTNKLSLVLTKIIASFYKEMQKQNDDKELQQFLNDNE